MKFTLPWRIKDTIDRNCALASAAASIYVALAIAFKQLPDPLWALAIWAPFWTIAVLRDWKRYGACKAIDDALRSGDASQLPPHVQEDIRIAWARKVLSEKD